MSQKTIQCQLTTPTQTLVNTDAVCVILPATEGDCAVMAGHSLLFTTLRQGKVTVDGKTYPVTRGYAHVSAQHCVIMADDEQEDR